GQLRPRRPRASHKGLRRSPHVLSVCCLAQPTRAGVARANVRTAVLLGSYGAAVLLARAGWWALLARSARGSVLRARPASVARPGGVSAADGGLPHVRHDARVSVH